MPSLYNAESSTTPHRNAAELHMDCRARAALEKEERAERRRQGLEEQRSEFNSPRVRVQAWEKSHGLRLPVDPAHPILYVIAQATRLTLMEIREEQQSRR